MVPEGHRGFSQNLLSVTDPEAGDWESPERALPAHRFAGEGS